MRNLSTISYDDFANYEIVKDNLFVKLTAKGRYPNAPTWTYADDMQMTIHIWINGNTTALVNNDMMRFYRLHGVSEEAVFEKAKENTDWEFGINVMPLDNSGTFESSCGAMIVSNNNLMFGAAALLLSDYLDKMYEVFKGKYYILPSSIHELICVPAEGGDADYLKSMVTEINKSTVDSVDKLTDSVYMYDGMFFTKVA